MLSPEEILYLAGDSSEFGSSSQAQIESLSKALLAPSSTDDFYDTSGGAITMQSLEGMLVDLTLNESDFTLWSDMNKIKAFSTVEEYDQQLGHGINDGGFVDQIENPEFRDPEIAKQIAIVKFMSEGWTVGDVAEATRRIVDERTRQQRSAMIRLLRNLNIALYNSNSTWIPKSIDGLAATIAGESTDQVRDLRGGNLSMANLNISAQLITENNGHVENARIYSSPSGMQNLSTIIEAGAASTGDRKIVDMGSGGITIGGKITGVMTPFGQMMPRLDKLLGLSYENRSVPQYYNQSTGAWVEGSTSNKAPSTPSFTITDQAVVANSNFSAGTTRPSGVQYSYRIVARNEYGRSAACTAVQSAAAVTAGGGKLLTITPAPGDSGDNLPTCFEIYSEQVSGSGTYRYMHTIAADSTNPLANVTYTDKNDYIPGCARMFIVDQTSVGEQRVLAFSQLLPIHNTDLAKVGRYSQGLINLYGVPKYYKPNVLIEIRNIGVTQSTANLYNTI